MNSTFLFCLALALSGGMFDRDILVSTILVLLIWAIPVSAAVRLITAQVSPQVRQSISRHPILHLIWLATAIAVMVSPFLLSPLGN